MELLLIFFISLFLIPLVALTTGPARILMGLFLIFFFPGYSFTAALFPRKDSLSMIERIALSFGLSIIVVPLIGLALNYTPWGIHLYPILASLLLFIFISSAIAIYRRWRLPSRYRFEPLSFLQLRLLYNSLAGQTGPAKLLSLILVLLIIGALGTLGFSVIKNKKIGLTEFYLLGLERKAENYPLRVRAGNDSQLVVNIVNKEYRTIQYRVEIIIDGQKARELGPIILNHGEKWEQIVSFTVTKAGQKQKVEFLLYKSNSNSLYDSLHLYVDAFE